MLIPEHVARQRHEEAKQGLRESMNAELAKILDANTSADQYWILAKVKFPKELGGYVGRVFMERSDVQPPFVRESFVYYVDNRKGTKQLLWMSWGDCLRIVPTGKTIKIQKQKVSSPEVLKLLC